jgi:hypothetical protein
MDTVPGMNRLGSPEADRSIDYLIRLMPVDDREPFPGHWYCPWLARYCKIPPPIYFQLRIVLRRTKAIADCITVSGPSFSAWRRSQSRRKKLANAAVARIQKQIETCRKVHGLAVVKWWRPRSNGKRPTKRKVMTRQLAA